MFNKHSRKEKKRATLQQVDLTNMMNFNKVILLIRKLHGNHPLRITIHTEYYVQTARAT